MEKFRRNLGIICIVVGILGYITLFIPTNPGIETQNIWADYIGTLFIFVWLFCSFIVKIKMINAGKSIRLNLFSLDFYLLTLIMVAVAINSAGYQATGTEYSFIGNILICLFLIGWPIVDFVDIFLPVPTKTPT